MRKSHSTVVIALVVACRSPSSTVPPDATATTSATTAAPSASTATLNAGVSLPTPRQVLDRWNDAHDKHDDVALLGLYAPTVQFYGQSLSATKCAAIKKAAFAKSPDYRQSVKDVSVEQDGAQTKVSFTKTVSVQPTASA
jgi:hypothetical protein